MLVWLDGRLNTRQRPQENFGREIMELFTFGIGHYNELDVYAAARVFTGWNLRQVNRGNDANSYYEFVFNAEPARHVGQDFHASRSIGTAARTIPARAAADGMQDGIDFITALATHPDTARRLARKLWDFFVSEVVRARRIDAERRRERLPADRHADRVARALHAAVASVPEPGQLAHALQLAGRVRRAGGQGGWLDRLLRRHAPRAADDDGSDAVRAAGRQRMGARVRDGSRPAACWRG